VYFAGTYDSDIARISVLLFSTTRRAVWSLHNCHSGLSN
jgi:hypothetical protein